MFYSFLNNYMHVFGLKDQRSWTIRHKHLKVYEYMSCYNSTLHYTYNCIFIFFSIIASNVIIKKLIFYAGYQIVMQFNVPIKNTLETTDL
jgi:hypothetical protein